jgi:HPt (histidine-containing phosphotransfer) domain-containing protein
VERAAALLASNDFDALKQIGHRMAGSGTSYGFPLLTELGLSLEQSARVGDRDVTEQHLDAMRDYLKQVRLSHGPPSPT